MTEEYILKRQKKIRKCIEGIREAIETCNKEEAGKKIADLINNFIKDSNYD